MDGLPVHYNIRFNSFSTIRAPYKWRKNRLGGSDDRHRQCCGGRVQIYIFAEATEGYFGSFGELSAELRRSQ